jgi:hypothetical protein
MSNHLSAREKLPNRQSQCVDWAVLAMTAAMKITPAEGRQALLDSIYNKFIMRWMDEYDKP